MTMVKTPLILALSFFSGSVLGAPSSTVDAAILGRQLEVEPNFQCNSNADCLNDGKCLINSSRTCQCSSGYGGHDCSSTRCNKDCQNGSSCRFHNDVSHGGSDQDGNTYCECLEGTTGVSCEIPFVTCGNDGSDDTMRCLWGGTCQQQTTGSGYKCHCPPPRLGDQCQYESIEDPRIPVSVTSDFECQKDTDCFNGGSCIVRRNPEQSNYCFCPKGYGGMDCSSNQCNKDCQNGGSCRFHPDDISHGDSDGVSYCECLSTHKGVHCEIPFEKCPTDGPHSDHHNDDNQYMECLWGGKCRRNDNVVGGPYTCLCPADRAGMFCQFEKDPTSTTTTTTGTTTSTTTTTATTASSSSTSGNDIDNSQTIQTALILVVAVLVGAGIITGLITFIMGRWCHSTTDAGPQIQQQTVRTRMPTPESPNTSTNNNEVAGITC